MKKTCAQFCLILDPCTVEEATAMHNHLSGLHAKANVQMHLLTTDVPDEATNDAPSAEPATSVAPSAPAPVAAPAAVPAVPVAAPATPATPAAPVATPTAPAAPATSTAAPAPEAASGAITLEALSLAGTGLVEQGKMEAVMSLLTGKYGVQALTDLDPSTYPAFAVDLRALGANI